MFEFSPKGFYDNIEFTEAQCYERFFFILLPTYARVEPVEFFRINYERIFGLQISKITY